MKISAIADAAQRLFLGNAPGWYKLCIVACLIINPFMFHALGAFIAGWLLVLEFIFTLAIALRCYPLQSGGLLALEAVLIGMASPNAVYTEVTRNLPVILLLMFMVAAIFFMQDLLFFLFARLLLSIRRKWLLSLLFLSVSALLSAFLDALTVTAVLITLIGGFYAVYHGSIAPSEDPGVPDATDLSEFRALLRDLLMHALVGTAIGGVATLVGEPQNLLIGDILGWNFMEFMHRMAPISLPVLCAGAATLLALEQLRWFGYGARLPVAVRSVLRRHAETDAQQHADRRLVTLVVQAIAGCLLIAALALHLAAVGLIGLALLVVLTAFTGITEEHRLAHAFEAAMPFTALLVVFFAIVAVIQQGHLFTPVIAWVLGFEGRTQIALLYAANGLLSSVSDNVFVATVYIKQIHEAFLAQAISHHQFEQFAVAINAGTNLPSVATPNGQAAFLFLLTSGLAPLIRLSYLRMVWMALPYTIVLTLTGLVALLVIV